MILFDDDPHFRFFIEIPCRNRGRRFDDGRVIGVPLDIGKDFYAWNGIVVGCFGIGGDFRAIFCGLNMDFGEANALRLNGAKPFHATRRRDALGGDVIAIEKQIAVISFDFRDERFHIGARRRCAGACKSSADGAENEQKRR